jgi:hypothetical protein
MQADIAALQGCGIVERLPGAPSSSQPGCLPIPETQAKLANWHGPYEGSKSANAFSVFVKLNAFC